MNYIKSIITACALSLIAYTNVQAQTADKNSNTKTEMKRTGSATFIFGKETPWEDLGDGVKRQILGYDDRPQIGRPRFDIPTSAALTRGKCGRPFNCGRQSSVNLLL